MGSSSSKKQLKEEYLKLVEKKKKSYAQQHPELYATPDVLDWRVSVYSAITQAAPKVSWAFWPSSLVTLLDKWDILMDQKWKSNLLWYDYLRSYQLQRIGVGLTTRSTLAIPLPNPNITTSLESTSLLDFLRGHLQAFKTHAIAAMIFSFSLEFYRFYSMNSAPSDNFELAIDIRDELDCKQVVKEIDLFVNLCLDAFTVYYRGVDLAQLMKESLVEVRDLIIDQTFEGPVSRVLLNVFQTADRVKEEVVEKNMELYADLKCEDLGISPFFCLDRVRTNGSPSQGYEKAIQCLRLVATLHSPMAKLNAVINSTRKVCECIDDYWKEDPDVTPEELVIDADQILGIYLFIVLKARIKSLGAHIRVMLEFVRKDVKQSTLGYYLSTIEASLENVAMLSPEFLKRLKQPARREGSVEPDIGKPV